MAVNTRVTQLTVTTLTTQLQTRVTQLTVAALTSRIATRVTQLTVSAIGYLGPITRRPKFTRLPAKLRNVRGNQRPQIQV